MVIYRCLMFGYNKYSRNIFLHAWKSRGRLFQQQSFLIEWRADIMLNINRTAENGKTVFSLEGRLDTVTSEELERQMTEIIDETDELVLDFAKLEYISSAGLRILLSAQKIMCRKGGLRVINVNETILDIFEVTGFSNILTIE